MSARRRVGARRYAVLLLAAVVVGLLPQSPRAEATSEAPVDASARACVEPLAPAVTLIDTWASGGRLVAGSPRTVELAGSEVAGTSGLILQATTESAVNPGTITATFEDGRVLPIAHTSSTGPSSATALLAAPGDRFVLSLEVGDVHVRLEAVAQITTSECLTALHSYEVASQQVVPGVPAPVDFAAEAGVPSDAQALPILAEVAAGNADTLIELVETDDSPDVVLTRRVPAGEVMVDLGVLPPSDTDRYELRVTGGPASVRLQPLGWFTSSNFYALGSGLLLDTRDSGGPLQPGDRIRIDLPAEADEAETMLVDLGSSATVGVVGVPRFLGGARLPEVSSPVSLPPSVVTQDASVYVWPVGEDRPANPTAELAAGRTWSQLLAVAPGDEQALYVEVAEGAAHLIVGFAGWAPVPPPANSVVDEIVHLPDEGVALSAQVDPTTFEATAEYSAEGRVDEGDILSFDVSDAFPDGYLGLVEDVDDGDGEASVASERDGGATVNVRLSPATLTDAVPIAEFDEGLGDYQTDEAPPVTEEPLPPAEFDPHENEQPAAPASSTSAVAVTDLSGAVTSPTLPTVSMSSTVPGSGRTNFSCTGGLSAYLEASLGLSYSPRLSAGWNRWHTRIDYVDFGYSGAVTGTIAAGVQGQASCELRRSFPGVQLGTLTFVVGGVPVTVTPKLSMSASLTGSVSGSVRASATVSAGLNGGIRYQNGGFQPYVQPSFSASARIDARAGGSLVADLTPRLDLLVWGRGGPFVEIGPHAELNVDPFANPWWNAHAELRARLGLSLDLWVWKGSTATPWYSLLRREAGRASGGYPGPVITTTSLPNGQVGSAYNQQLSATGAAPPSFKIVAGRLPAGLSMSTGGRISGTPTSADSQSFRLQVIDGAGYKSLENKTLSISVGNAPPPPPPPDPGGGGGGGTPPPIGPSVSLAKGASAQGRDGCSSSACRFLAVTVAAFPANTDIRIECWASNAARFYSYTFRTNSSGGGSSSVCYYGFPGQDVWALANGVRSNTVRW